MINSDLLQSNKKIDYREFKNFFELFSGRVKQFPDAIAIERDKKEISYKKLQEEVDALAYHIAITINKDKDKEKFLTSEECLTAIYLDRGLAFIVSILACMQLGIPYLPIDSKLPHEVISDMLLESKCPWIITSLSFPSVIFPPACKKILFNTSGPISGPFDIKTDNELMYVMYTSGSTGKPKGVMIGHQGISNCLAAHNDVIEGGIKPEDKWAYFASMGFDASVAELLALGTGARLVIVPSELQNDYKGLANFYKTHKITIAIFTPKTLEKLSPDDFPDLRALFIVGAAFPKELADKWRSKTRQVFNGFGLTETSVCSHINKCSDKELSIGKPIEGFNVYLRPFSDDEGYTALTTESIDKIEWISPDQQGKKNKGELFISGKGLAKGYWRNKNLTEERFIFSKKLKTTLYRTGDVCRFNVDGELEFLCRYDRQLKIRGQRIESEHVECCVRELEDIEEVCVVVEKSKENHLLVMYLVPKDKNLIPKNYELNSNKEAFLLLSENAIELLKKLSMHCRNKLPIYAVPGLYQMILVEKLPMKEQSGTKGGVNYKEVQQWQRPIQKISTIIRPRDEIEISIHNVWAEVLNFPSHAFGIYEDFFELGGDSILFGAMFVKLNELELNEEPIKRAHFLEFFTPNPSIATISAYVSMLTKKSRSPVVKLKEAIESKSPNLYVIHSLMGNTNEYAKLIQSLPGQNIIGLDVRQAEGIFPSFELIALDYIRSLQSLHPKGTPWYLLGYSTGGLIALKMAEYLKKAQINCQVILIDTQCPVFLNKLSLQEHGTRLYALTDKLINFFQAYYGLSKDIGENVSKELFNFNLCNTSEYLKQIRMYFFKLIMSIAKHEKNVKKRKAIIDKLYEIQQLYIAEFNYKISNTMPEYHHIKTTKSISKSDHYLGWNVAPTTYKDVAEVDHFNVLNSEDVSNFIRNFIETKKMTEVTQSHWVAEKKESNQKFGISDVKSEEIFQPSTKDIIRIKIPREYYKELSKISIMGHKTTVNINEIFINLVVLSKKDQEKLFADNIEKSIDATDKKVSTIVEKNFEDLTQYKQSICVDAKTIFDLKTEKGQMPKKILITAEAGMGKSTLCTQIVWEYQNNELLPKFNCVFFISLKTLNNKKDLTWKDVIFNNCIKIEHKQNWNSIWNYVVNCPEETLYILDGYDELTSTSVEAQNLVKELLSDSKKNVVLTSRAYGITSEIRGFFDNYSHHLEIVGFTKKEINNYIDKFFSLSMQTDVKKIIELLEKNPSIYAAAQKPINLALFCSFWQISLNKKEKIEEIGLTNLYGKIILEIIKRYLIERCEKNSKDFSLLEDSDILDFKFNDVVSVSELLDFLELFCYNSVKDNFVIFKGEMILQLLDSFCLEKSKKINIDKLTLKLAYIKILLNLGLISQDTDISLDIKYNDYSFTHLTFRDFLAASYIKKKLEADVNESIYSEIINSIAMHKYNPRYQFVWSFVAGLFVSNKNELKKYFQLLQSKPQDVRGHGEAMLLIRCIEQTKHADFDGKKDLIEKLKDFIRGELLFSNIDAFIFLLKNSPIFLAETDILSVFLDQLGNEKPTIRSETAKILAQLWKEDITVTQKLLNLLQYTTILEKINAIIEAVNYLNIKTEKIEYELEELKNHKIEQIHKWVNDKLKILHEKREQINNIKKFHKIESAVFITSSLSLSFSDVEDEPYIINCLLEQIQNKDWKVRQAVANAFSRINNKSELIIYGLCTLLDDNVEFVKWAALRAIVALNINNENVIQKLLEVIERSNTDITQEKIIYTLGCIATKKENVIKKLLPYLKDQKTEISTSCILALGKLECKEPNYLNFLVDKIKFAISTGQPTLVKRLTEILNRIGIDTSIIIIIIKDCLIYSDVAIKKLALEIAEDFKIKDENIFSIFLNLMENDPSEEIKDLACRALIKLASDKDKYIIKILRLCGNSEKTLKNKIIEKIKKNNSLDFQKKIIDIFMKNKNIASYFDDEDIESIVEHYVDFNPIATYEYIKKNYLNFSRKILPNIAAPNLITIIKMEIKKESNDVELLITVNLKKIIDNVLAKKGVLFKIKDDLHIYYNNDYFVLSCKKYEETIRQIILPYLLYAMKQENLIETIKLLDYYGDINQKTNVGYPGTLLYWAAYYNKKSIVEFFLDMHRQLDKLKILSSSELDSTILAGQAESLFSDNQKQRAIELFQKALSLNENNTIALAGLSNCLFQDSNYQQAFKLVKKILMLDPQNIFSWRLLATELATEGKYREAIKYLDNALKISPKNIDVLNYKAWYLLEEKNYIEVWEIYKDLLKIDKKNSITLNGIGCYYFQKSFYSKALTYMTDAITNSSDDEQKHVSLSNKAECLIFLGSYREAIKYCDESITINNNYNDALCNKGIALFMLKENYEKAYTYFSDIIYLKDDKYKNKKTKLFAKIGLGMYYYVNQDHNKADELFYEVFSDKIVFGKLKEELYLTQALMFSSINQNDAFRQAYQCYQTLLKEDENCVSALYGKGQLFLILSMINKSKSCFKRVLKIMPENQDVIFILNKIRALEKNNQIDVDAQSHNMNNFNFDNEEIIEESDEEIEYFSYKKRF